MTVNTTVDHYVTSDVTASLTLNTITNIITSQYICRCGRQFVTRISKVVPFSIGDINLQGPVHAATGWQ